MQRFLALILITILLSGCVTELWGKTLPGAYSHPGSARDLYRVGVIVCDNSVFTVIVVEAPFSSHADRAGWFVIPLDVDLRPWCQ